MLARSLAIGARVERVLELVEAIETWVGDDLPATINPLQFFVDNWWRNTLVAVYVDGRVPQADNWYLLSYLRDRIPPNLLLVLIVGLKGGEASMVIGDDTSSLAETMKPIEEPRRCGPPAQLASKPC